jgi:hypothetical protein
VSADRIERPIFLVGMGRSGSTMIFEVLAAHPDLGWFSNYCDVFSAWPGMALVSRLCDLSPVFRKAVTPSDQAAPWIDRFRVGPSEAYRLWQEMCGEKFRYDYLLGVRATTEERARTRRAVRQVLRWQGKPRFAAKITGPPRMEYLSSIFPDAIFVHIVRDGRAVVHSLLNVDFWKDRGRLHEPAWGGGFPEPYRQRWEDLGRSPLVLAALQWRAVVEAARLEAEKLLPGQYHELRYEDFLGDPRQALQELCRTCDLRPSSRMEAFLSSRFRLHDRNVQHAERFTPEERRMLQELLDDPLRRMGYDEGGAAEESGSG